jgi:hypothetical protein
MWLGDSEKKWAMPRHPIPFSSFRLLFHLRVFENCDNSWENLPPPLLEEESRQSEYVFFSRGCIDWCYTSTPPFVMVLSRVKSGISAALAQQARLGLMNTRLIFIYFFFSLFSLC